MLSIGVLGVNYKVADLGFREEIARAAEILRGVKGLFFPYPTVLLSTCNRTEVYFSAPDLAEAHGELLSHLRLKMQGPFEHKLYSYFGLDCMTHLCRVTAGLDSAILAETAIQRQVKTAYQESKQLNSALHFAFQKALKVGKNLRTKLHMQKGPTLYNALWQLAEWNKKKIFLVGFSEINRGLLSFLSHKGSFEITLCTKKPSQVRLEHAQVVDRLALNHWNAYDIIVAASKADQFLIQGKSSPHQIIFDLSVPRNVDPQVGGIIYNIEAIHAWIQKERSISDPIHMDEMITENALKLVQMYRFKTQRRLQIVGMG